MWKRKRKKDSQEDNDNRLSSEDLAALIVDALEYAGIVAESEFEKAVTITAEEIDARKAVGDY